MNEWRVGDKEGGLSGGNALFCHQVYGTKGYITNLMRTHSSCKLLVYKKNSFSLLVYKNLFSLLVLELIFNYWSEKKEN